MNTPIVRQSDISSFMLGLRNFIIDYLHKKSAENSREIFTRDTIELYFDSFSQLEQRLILQMALDDRFKERNRS